MFTKSRPLQLDAYLESLYRYFPSELIQTYIIYKVELFNEEYKKLFQKHSGSIVINESDFHSDFLGILNRVNTKYILFGIDDVVYFDSVDYEMIDRAFSEFADKIFGFSLRFGNDSLDISSDPIEQRIVADQNVYSLNWTEGHTPKTRYPFELCATIYPATLVKMIINSMMSNSVLVKSLFSPGSFLIKILSKVLSSRSILKFFGYFFSPNTLESWSCRWCQNHSNKLPGFLFFQKQCASAIQVNMVNMSTLDDKFQEDDEYTVEVLANKYRQGYTFDFDYLTRNKPTGTHCGTEYFKLVQDKAVCAPEVDRK